MTPALVGAAVLLLAVGWFWVRAWPSIAGSAAEIEGRAERTTE